MNQFRSMLLAMNDPGPAGERERNIRAWLSLNTPVEPGSAVWQRIFRREAERAVDGGWRSN